VVVLGLVIFLLIPRGGGAGAGSSSRVEVAASDDIPPGVISPVDFKVDSPSLGAGGKTPDQLADQMIDQMNELAVQLNSIRDAASLNAVKSRLPSDVARINATMRQLRDLERAGRSVSSGKKRELDPRQAQIQANLGQAAAKLVEIPGAVDLVPEIRKIGQVGSTEAEAQAFMRMTPEEHLKSLVGKHGAQKTVVLVIEGLPKERIGLLADKVLSAAPGLESRPAPGGDRVAFCFAPVADLNAFAAKLDLGETKVNSRKRIILVKADTAKLPTPPAAEVTDPNDPNFYKQNLADLKSTNMGRRWNAVKRLKTAEPKELRAEIAAALRERLDDENGFVGQDAVDAYPLWATGDYVPELIAILENKNRLLLHQRIVERLGKLKDPRAIKPLAARMRTDYLAKEALKQFGPAAEPELILLLDDPDFTVRGYACEILEVVGTAKSLEKVKALVGDTNGFVQLKAKTAAESITRRTGEAK
jgi:hypothetical protein